MNKNNIKPLAANIYGLINRNHYITNEANGKVALQISANNFVRLSKELQKSGDMQQLACSNNEFLLFTIPDEEIHINNDLLQKMFKKVPWLYFKLSRTPQYQKLQLNQIMQEHLLNNTNGLFCRAKELTKW